MERLRQAFRSGRSDLGLFLLLRVVQAAPSPPSPSQHHHHHLLGSCYVQPVLVLCRFVAPTAARVTLAGGSGEHVTTASAHAGAPAPAPAPALGTSSSSTSTFGSTVFKKVKKVRHLTAGQLAAQRTKEREQQQQQEQQQQEEAIGGGSGSAVAREPSVVCSAALTLDEHSAGLQLLLPPSEGGVSAAMQSLLVALEPQIQECVRRWVRPAAVLGVPGPLPAPVAIGGEQAALTLHITPNRDTVAVTFRFLAGIDGATALVCCPVAGGSEEADQGADRCRISVRCFGYPPATGTVTQADAGAEAEAEANRQCQAHPSFLSLGHSLLAGEATRLSASASATPFALDSEALVATVRDMCAACYPLLKFAYLACLQASDALARARRSAEALMATQKPSSAAAGGAEAEAGGVGQDLRLGRPSMHTVTSVSLLKCLSLSLPSTGSGGGDSGGPALLFTSHRYVFEYNGLQSELTAEHTGGVVRVSLASGSADGKGHGGGGKQHKGMPHVASPGDLVVSDGLPGFDQAAFAEESVPAAALRSSEGFETLVLSLLERQGLP